MSTAIGAAFGAVELDEEVDSISVAPGELDSQCRKIAAFSERRGHSPSTGASYARSWRRLATIAHRWKLEGGDDAGPEFWETVEDLRDTRPKRLRPIVPDDPGNQEQLDSFTVKLSTGRATVALPDGATDADLVVLVRAIVSRKR
jgi:hypothetical protein